MPTCLSNLVHSVEICSYSLKYVIVWRKPNEVGRISQIIEEIQGEEEEMVKVKNVKMEDYEKRDPLWWCQYYKSGVGMLCLRIDQYLNAETEEEKAVTESLLKVLIDNFNEKGIGFVIPYGDDNDGEEAE